ncbi:MAG: excisionase family DNA-binding protein [Candidatus Pacebacteria bacterium]|nr:excisionase family DNA-binding protein [Candidatus Paceibacterota bacterium]
MGKDLLSTTEVAKLLGISRIAVFKQIKAGKIKAKKAGRNFIIHKQDLPFLLEGALSDSKKRQIEESVKKTIKEYGEAIKLLGAE